MKLWSISVLVISLLTLANCSSAPSSHEKLNAGTKLTQMNNPSIAFDAKRAPSGDFSNLDPSQKKEKLRVIIDHFLKHGAPGVVLVVDAPDVKFGEAAGYADIDTHRKMKKSDLIRIASVSKTFFGALATTLHLQGKINLDSTLGESFPDVAAKFKPMSDPRTGEIWDPKVITMRMMLNHTAGIDDPLSDSGFISQWKKHLQDKTPLTEDEALQTIFGIGLTHKPIMHPTNKDWVYSNGGYILASYLVSRALGHHWTVEMKDKIIAPIGLNNTFLGNTSDFDPKRLIHGYDSWTMKGVADWAFADQGNGHANGGLVSSADDVMKFYRSLFLDKSYPNGVDKAAFLSEFLPKPGSGLSYGMGIAIDSNGCFFHAGHFMGYLATALYCPKQDLTMFVAVNRDDQLGFDSSQNNTSYNFTGFSTLQISELTKMAQAAKQSGDEAPLNELVKLTSNLGGLSDSYDILESYKNKATAEIESLWISR